MSFHSVRFLWKPEILPLVYIAASIPPGCIPPKPLIQLAKMRALSVAAVSILLLQYASLVTLTSAQDAPLIPAVKFAAEPQQEDRSVIRGLMNPDLSKRQTYYCPAPRYTCEYRYCCLNVNYRCCRGESPLLGQRSYIQGFTNMTYKI